MSGSALMFSGGKDSTLALHHAQADGPDVRVLLNLYDRASSRVRFHGVRAGLIAAQAASLGIELLQRATDPDTFEATFLDALGELRARGIDAVVFGNIHLADVRAWYEERTTGTGLRHVEPLWGMAPADVVAEFVATGYRARITSVDLERLPREWLGCELDADLLARLKATPGVDAAGEHGEYHTFVHDGPLFRNPLVCAAGAAFETETHALLDLL